MGPKILDADPSDESLVGFRHDLTEKLWVWPCGQHAANWIVGRAWNLGCRKVNRLD